MRCVRPAAVSSDAFTVPMNGRLMKPWSSIWTLLVVGSGTPMMATVRLSPGRSCEADATDGITGLRPVGATVSQPALIPMRAIIAARGRCMVRAPSGSALAARLAARLRSVVVLLVNLLVLALRLGVVLVVVLLLVGILVPFQGLVVLQLLLLLGVDGGKVVLLLLRGLGRQLLVGVQPLGHEVEDGAQLGEGVHGLALYEMGVLLLADLVLHLVNGELVLEIEEVVQHLHAAAGEVVEQVGIRTVLLVEDVRQDEELLLRLKYGFLHPLETDLPAAQVLLDPEGDECGLEQVLVEAVVAKRVHELDQVRDLPRVDNAQAVHVPAHGVARLENPPVVVFAESYYAPFQGGCGLSHWYQEILDAAC